MPNKYEREIEEILRNLERTEPKAGLRRNAGERPRRKSGTRRSISFPNFSFAEWCLIVALVAALVAGGWAYAQNNADLFTGTIALIGAVCLVLVALSNFLVRPRYRSSEIRPRTGNVTRFPGNPLRRLATSWHLLMLKLRYRNKNRGDR